MKNITAIACTKVPLEIFAFREVVTLYDGSLFLENVNVLFGDKIIKKIRFAQGEKPYVKGMGKEIAIKYLKSVLEKNKQKSTVSSTVNKTAATKAAKDLFSNLGI